MLATLTISFLTIYLIVSLWLVFRMSQLLLFYMQLLTQKVGPHFLEASSLRFKVIGRILELVRRLTRARKA
jgi:hypothetical protein